MKNKNLFIILVYIPDSSQDQVGLNVVEFDHPHPEKCSGIMEASLPDRSHLMSGSISWETNKSTFGNFNRNKHKQYTRVINFLIV